MLQLQCHHHARQPIRAAPAATAHMTRTHHYNVIGGFHHCLPPHRRDITDGRRPSFSEHTPTLHFTGYDCVGKDPCPHVSVDPNRTPHRPAIGSDALSPSNDEHYALVIWYAGEWNIQVLPVISAFELDEAHNRILWGRSPLAISAPQTTGSLHSLDHRAAIMALWPPNSPVTGPVTFKWDTFWQFEIKLTDSLTKGESIDDYLGEMASRKQDVATLVSWVEDITATPITQEAAPGEMVQSDVGPILVNLFEESYRVRATVGMALVASDGEVILRYRDDFESILGEQRNPNRVGRDLAMSLAREITKMWPIDPRLDEHSI